MATADPDGDPYIRIAQRNRDLFMVPCEWCENGAIEGLLCPVCEGDGKRTKTLEELITDVARLTGLPLGRAMERLATYMLFQAYELTYREAAALLIIQITARPA